MRKCRVEKEDTGVWVAEVPQITADGQPHGYVCAWFDTWREAMAFTFAGPFIVHTDGGTT